MFSLIIETIASYLEFIDIGEDFWFFSSRDIIEYFLLDKLELLILLKISFILELPFWWLSAFLLKLSNLEVVLSLVSSFKLKLIEESFLSFWWNP